MISYLFKSLSNEINVELCNFSSKHCVLGYFFDSEVKKEVSSL